MMITKQKVVQYFKNGKENRAARQLAKTLRKMPEYKKFEEKHAFYNCLLGNSKYLPVHVDSFESFKKNPVLYADVHEKLAEHLDSWKESSDAIFSKEIEKTKGELTQDAKELLKIAKINDEKSKAMASLEKLNAASKKIGKKISVASAISCIGGIVYGGVYNEPVLSLDVLISIPVIVVSVFSGIFGLSLWTHGIATELIQNFKRAINIENTNELQNPDSQDVKQYKKTEWQFHARI